MHKDLIIEAFEKARQELQLEGEKDPSNHQLSIKISQFLTEDFGFSYTKERIGYYFRIALQANHSEDITIAQRKVVQGLCQYLGFENYEAFVRQNSEEEEDVTYKNNVLGGETEIVVKPKNKKLFAWYSNATAANKKFISILVLVIIVGTVGIISGVYLFSEKTRWMVWKGDHYEEVQFDSDELANGSLKLYKEDRIEHFRQIQNADCDYDYFNADGSVRVWYGKNKYGELEYFTDIGLHPETGKSLKQITEYMIKTHICPTY